LKSLTGKSDTIHTNIQINRPKSVCTQEYVWEITKKIFCHIGSPQVKISQKSFREATFFESHCARKTCMD